MEKKQSKRWVIIFLLLVLSVTAIYMVLCFRANPEGYFTNIQGQPYYFSDDYSRAIKTRYLLDHKEEIDGIILGGSKCGAVDTDLMEEYTGLHFYNMYLNLGNFKDYLAYTKFAVEQIGVQEIDLVLSSYEVLAYDRTYRGNNYQIPALLEGGPFEKIKEFLSWCIVDPSTLLSSWKRLNKNPAYGDAVADGRRSRMKNIISFNKNPEKYANKLLDEYNENLQILFTGEMEDHSEVMKQNIDALREIRQICKEANVTLRVIIGPSTMTERYRYENESYYEYMAEIVDVIGEVWDFSDYNDINMNLYNYADKLHYDLEVADLMVHTVFNADKYEGFGQILTRENIDAAIDARTAQFDALYNEYLETGTVALQGRDDDSYLPWRTTWISSKGAQEEMGIYWNSVTSGAPVTEEETELDLD